MAVDPTKLAQILDVLGKGLTRLVQMPGKAASTIGGLAGAPAQLLGIPSARIDQMITPITKAFTGVIDNIMNAAGPLVGLVSKMDPTTVQLFEFAINDMMAVFGDILKPILVEITRITRQMADVFKTMKPVFDPIIATVVKLLKVFTTLINPLASIAVPVLGILGQLLEQLVLPLLEKFAEVLQWVAKATVWSINTMILAFNELKKFSDIMMLVSPALALLLKVLDLKIINFEDLKKESSMGQSIRDVGRMSGVDIGKRTREGAFGQVAWQGKMLENANKMLDLFNRLPVEFAKTQEWLKQIKDQLSRQAGQQNAG